MRRLIIALVILSLHGTAYAAKCKIELGKAVSASHMAKKAKGRKLYLWDLRTEAIVCSLQIPSTDKRVGNQGSLTAEQIVDGTMLTRGMKLVDVIRLLGRPETKFHTKGGWIYGVVFKNRICMKKSGKKKRMPGTCILYFETGSSDPKKKDILTYCENTEFGVCSMDMRSDPGSIRPMHPIQ